MTEFAKANGFTAEQAAAYGKSLSAAAKAGNDAAAALIGGWRTASAADPELADGGKLKEDVTAAAISALKQFGGGKDGADFLKFLKETGASEHPEVLRFLARVGKSALAGGKYVQGAAPRTEATLAQKLFTTSTSLK